MVDVREASKEDAGYLAKYIGKANQITAALLDLGFTRTWSRSRSWPVDRFKLVPTAEQTWKKVSAHFPGDWKELAHNQMTTKEWIEWTAENPWDSVGTDLNFEMEEENHLKRVRNLFKKQYKELQDFDYQATNNRNEAGAVGPGPRDGVVAYARRGEAPGRVRRDSRYRR